MCLFIINEKEKEIQKKRNIKSRKIDKRKRKMLVSKAFHNIVQEFVCLSAINFRIHYLRNFIFRFPVNYNWSRSWLYFLRKSVRHGGFEHRHMENWVNRIHGLWKTESE